MEFQKAIKTYHRWCRMYPDCEGCPLETYIKSGLCSAFLMKHPDIIEPILEKWEQEHPERTILTEFLEHYPNAKLARDGTPEDVCPRNLGYMDIDDCTVAACMRCWNRTPEEASKEK